MSCEKRMFRQCWWNAAFSLTQPKVRTRKLLLTAKNWQKKLQLESADAILLPVRCRRREWPRAKQSRCNRTSIKRRYLALNAASRSVHTKKARAKRKAHRNQPAQKHAQPQQIRRPDLDLPILTSAQMRPAEEAAFARGVQVEALMDQAGAGVEQTVAKFFAKPGKCLVFAGKGHNAGDALVAADCLRRLGWKIEVRLAFKENDCSELMRKKLESVRRRPPQVLGATPARMGTTDIGITLVELWAEVADELAPAQEEIAAEAYLGTDFPLIVLDGLLGVGARPPLREPIRTACRSINRLRKKKGAYVFAVDLPTG